MGFRRVVENGGCAALCAKGGSQSPEERLVCEGVGEAVTALPPAPASPPGAAAPSAPAR
jgi:hypothetical protein